MFRKFCILRKRKVIRSAGGRPNPIFSVMAAPFFINLNIGPLTIELELRKFCTVRTRTRAIYKNLTINVC